jgi:hypothetical protein
MPSPPFSKGSLADHRPASMTDITGTQAVYASPWSTAQYEIKPDSSLPLIHVQIPDNARLDDSLNTTDLKDIWFCSRSSGCECPPETIDTVPGNQPLGPHPLLGMAAASQTSQGIVSFHDIDEFCRREKPFGIGGTWNGSYQSTKYKKVHGSFRVTFVTDKKHPTVFTGSIVIANSDCTTNGELSGHLNGGKITFGTLRANGRNVTFAGNVSGDSMAGVYSSPACGRDLGHWEATR